MQENFNRNFPNFQTSQTSEKQVLGAIIQDGRLIEKADISPSDFYNPKDQVICSIMKDMERRSMTIDILTLFEEARKTGKEEMIGGFNYLGYLVELTVTTANFDCHLKAVKETSIKRELINRMYQVSELARNGGSLESIRTEIAKLIEALDTNTERPEMKKEAYYGLVGEMVNLISPHSEADPVALLANFLTAYGNAIGDNAHFKVEADEHPMRINPVMVGDSSKGRKGTSWGYIERLFEIVDKEWTSKIKTGLSSGEGLIWVVRNPITKIKNGAEEVIDDGVKDKRLLLIEPEFARVLKVMEREGNILSSIIRCAWDTGNLHILTTGRQNSIACATGAHISIISHITREELLRHLSMTEMANGFGNRFLWLYVRRSKTLPFGGGFHKENLEPLIKKLKAAIEFGKDAEELTWGDETRPLWEAVYPKLSEGKPGLIGALIARAEAYVTRLACIYALLDRSRKIKPEHLKAALALWEYAETSVKFIFRNSSGVPLVNELRELKGRQNVSKTEIYNHLSRNYSAEEIGQALAYMQEHGEASKGKIQTGKKPKEVWDF